MKRSRADSFRPERRRFLQIAAMLAVGGRTLLSSRDARAALDAAREVARADIDWPELPTRKLGRTGWNASRLVFGCGAALSRTRRDDLLEAALDAGINVFDVGFRGYYRDAEANLAPFLARHRERVHLVSKAIAARPEPGESLTPAACGEAARTWSARLDASLGELGVEKVDAYYLMAANNVDLVASDEIREAFEAAKRAGKVDHLGLSTHQNAARVLDAAVAGGAYSLAMIAITPAGWYDWETKRVLDASPPLTALRPVLDRARAAGIGLVGMKAGRALTGGLLRPARQGLFDAHYDERARRAPLSAFQKSYAFVLAHGLDVVNADMQSLAHLRENVQAAVESPRVFV